MDRCKVSKQSKLIKIAINDIYNIVPQYKEQKTFKRPANFVWEQAGDSKSVVQAQYYNFPAKNHVGEY